MGEVEQLRQLAERLDGLCEPVERELSAQLQSGDFAGPLADEADETVGGTRRALAGLAEKLRDIADERE
ncbi:hypothetical protein CLV30_105270 [Haloactinopolyspora alba]|uniref:Uncharacterized protein n=1 Tax=Haloactinopolyspora alba TaxID=648780 RepID=A0A2P8E5S1_9ACTN|nr:hypothetical protein [Haloactinopolyspora alba]PSL04803.1 hypothetical protein CLV30_105270 [Haloactinopolyspora alba]